MAVMQPFGVQQPMLTMPQAYVPMAAYTAAPVQPAVAPVAAIPSAPAMQMPAPTAPSSASFPVHASAPAPAPAQVPVVPPLSSAPTQMPQPYPVHEPPPNPIPAIPPTPVIGPPVIPPPPIFTSESRSPYDSTRPRFTGFYRPADLPPPTAEPEPMPEPMSDAMPGAMPEPARAPTTGQPGRTPYRASAPMPTPGPARMPASGNPLPLPPADVWASSPYRRVLENLPTDISTIMDIPAGPTMLAGVAEPPRPPSRLGGLFSSSSHKDKGKGPLRNLFRSRSTSVHGDGGSSSGSRHGHSRSTTSIVIPAPVPNTSTMPTPFQGPPIRFDHTGSYAGFVNHSNHRVMYKNKMYPTALHLLEAMKFTHRPDLQERIRTCKDVHDMYPLSASLQEHVRSDWGQVFLQIVRGLFLSFFICLGSGLAEGVVDGGGAVSQV